MEQRRAAMGAVLMAIVGVLALSTPASAEELTLTPIADGFEFPTDIAIDPSDSSRLFVTEKGGAVRTWRNGESSTLIDLSANVATGGGEQGMLAIALAPDFDQSGLLYIFYTRSPDNAVQIDELHVSGDAADPASRRSVITIPHERASSHNGGELQFGPDGYLYVSVGDSVFGPPIAGDARGTNGQDLTTLLGKVLRIDPRAQGGSDYAVPTDNPFVDGDPGTRDEIWAYGFRNPFRFSFDREAGDIWLTDVGEADWEEISVGRSPASARGQNFGWACREGFEVFRGELCQPGAQYVDPVFAYPHQPGAAEDDAWGLSITGGYVARDPELRGMTGRYLYSDFSSGQLRSLAVSDDGTVDDRLEGSVENPVSFAEDSEGRLYVLSAAGTVLQIGQKVATRLRFVNSKQTASGGRRVELALKAEPCPAARQAFVSLHKGNERIGRARLDRRCRARFEARIRGKRTRLIARLAEDEERLGATARAVVVRRGGVLRVNGAAGGEGSADAKRFAAKLPIPDVLEGKRSNEGASRRVGLTMEASNVPILPGRETRMWTFNGSFPGPTIRARSGKPLKVTVTNRLPEGAGSMTLHNHGGHTPAVDDGHPNRNLVEPGEQRTYTYPLREDGAPERAAFQWYHDHRDMVTARNIWRGLAGMLVVEDRFERELDLPRGRWDVPLMIADRSFNKRNQLVEHPEERPEGGASPPGDQVIGDTVLVNGAPTPHFEVADRSYRLRLLNAANFRTYELQFSDGRKMTQIANESGLLPASVERESIALGPAERAEILVDFEGERGENVILRGSSGPIMQFRVRKNAKSDGSDLDLDTLRPVAPETVEDSTPDRTWSFDLGSGGDGDRLAWTINGMPYDPNRIDAQVPLGEREVWRFTNPSSVAHVVHLHGTDFRVLSRNGGPPSPDEVGLKESVLLRANESVDVAVRFTDNTGIYILHCHMLEHEDNGMMTQVEVVSPSPAPRRLPPTALSGTASGQALLLTGLAGGPAAALMSSPGESPADRPYQCVLDAAATQRPGRSHGRRVRT